MTNNTPETAGAMTTDLSRLTHDLGSDEDGWYARWGPLELRAPDKASLVRKLRAAIDFIDADGR